MPRSIGNSNVTTAITNGSIRTAHLFEAVLFDTANNVEEVDVCGAIPFFVKLNSEKAGS